MATDKLVEIDHVTDYISREAAIEAAFDYRVDVIENDYDRGYQKAVIDIAKELNSIPTADVRPVVRGKWIRGNESRTSPTKDSYICSVCGEKTLSGFCGNPAKTNFCPNCGCAMENEK